MNPFTAVGQSVVAAANSLVRAMTIIDKVLGLAENEVDALEQGQQIRLDEVKFERKQLQAEREAKRQATANFTTEG